MLVDSYWTTVEYFEIMNEITLQKLYEFACQFFKNVKILGLIQGNVSQAQAIELCEKFETILHCTPLGTEQPHVKFIFILIFFFF